MPRSTKSEKAALRSAEAYIWRVYVAVSNCSFLKTWRVRSLRYNMLFSVGHVLEFIDATILNPWLSILVPVGLQLLTESKLSIRVDAKSLLGYHLGPVPSIQSKALKLVGAGLLLRLNRAWSSRALNNGTQAKFEWNEEIVLLTGAAGGIGAEAAQKFAKKGSKVVVLDVLPLTYPARE